MTQEKKLNWQDAVALLTKERTLAVENLKVLKVHGGAEVVFRGRVLYGYAKAEYDGIINGLLVAVASKNNPTSLSNLQDNLRQAFEKREDFCRIVKELHNSAEGQKDISGIVTATIGPLIEALKAIFLKTQTADELTRKTIQTQLRAALWPEYESVLPRAS
jgi:hypothetical protein